jgi:hypothetical protein
MNNIHGSHIVWIRRQKSKIHKRHDQEETDINTWNNKNGQLQ